MSTTSVPDQDDLLLEWKSRADVAAEKNTQEEGKESARIVLSGDKGHAGSHLVVHDDSCLGTTTPYDDVLYLISATTTTALKFFSDLKEEDVLADVSALSSSSSSSMMDQDEAACVGKGKSSTSSETDSGIAAGRNDDEIMKGKNDDLSRTVIRKNKSDSVDRKRCHTNEKDEDDIHQKKRHRREKRRLEEEAQMIVELKAMKLVHPEWFNLLNRRPSSTNQNPLAMALWLMDVMRVSRAASNEEDCQSPSPLELAQWLSQRKPSSSSNTASTSGAKNSDASSPSSSSNTASTSGAKNSDASSPSSSSNTAS
eukprot:CAMPEP_0176168300 /NCGR_PEP_ID=MMETSP0120_2-20121206/86130_1 /TAXON_ID=160619 /ORGANISM="Kryptoperidinium foliaceum, Strain CCMP 1326" /LENGTH=311 /DNA_ID=CAMNT_0017505993 /DNA_START=193 /DNA_END=1125 /DNA_ORIENTATION=-